MGIVKGLKDLNKTLDKPQSSGGDSVKGRWVKLEDGESVKVRFLQELDPDSPTYNDKLGLGFIAVEHTNPKDYRRKALCTIDDQGRCWGCHLHADSLPHSLAQQSASTCPGVGNAGVELHFSHD